MLDTELWGPFHQGRGPQGQQKVTAKATPGQPHADWSQREPEIPLAAVGQGSGWRSMRPQSSKSKEQLSVVGEELMETRGALVMVPCSLFTWSGAERTGRT